MGNTPVTIGLAIDQSTYESGSPITGRVYLSVKAPEGVAANSINLQIQGEETAKIHRTTDEGNERRNHYYHSSSPVLQFDTPLATFSDHIAPGQYEFPFISKLPCNLPPSMTQFSGESKCEILYKINAHLVQPGGGGGGLFRSWVANGYRSQPKTIDILGASRSADTVVGGIVLPPETERVKFFCCFNRGTMTIQAELDRAILSPGENVDLSFRCKNESTSSSSGVNVALREIITWRANGHQKTSSRLLGKQFVPSESLPELCPLPHLAKNYFGAPAVVNHSSIGNNKNNDNNSQSYEPLATGITASPKRHVSFLLSRDARDTYHGSIIQIDHELAVTINTECCMNNPESAIRVNIERPPPLAALASPMMATSALPSAPSYSLSEIDGIPDAEVTVLPPDWSAETADLVTIQIAKPVVLSSSNENSIVQSSESDPYSREPAPSAVSKQPLAGKSSC